MTALIVLVLAAIATAVAYQRGLRSSPQAKHSYAGWVGLGVLALLFVGLWAAVQAGNEAAAYGFGASIALVILVLLLVSVASAIGRAVQKRRGPTH
jgi:NADH:ubiquinone oxidoreductase subunit 6 (subunit J)